MKSLTPRTQRPQRMVVARSTNVPRLRPLAGARRYSKPSVLRDLCGRCVRHQEVNMVKASIHQATSTSEWTNFPGLRPLAGARSYSKSSVLRDLCGRCVRHQEVNMVKA